MKLNLEKLRELTAIESLEVVGGLPRTGGNTITFSCASVACPTISCAC